MIATIVIDDSNDSNKTVSLLTLLMIEQFPFLRYCWNHSHNDFVDSQCILF